MTKNDLTKIFDIAENLGLEKDKLSKIIDREYSGSNLQLNKKNIKKKYDFYYHDLDKVEYIENLTGVSIPDTILEKQFKFHICRDIYTSEELASKLKKSFSISDEFIQPILKNGIDDFFKSGYNESLRQLLTIKQRTGREITISNDLAQKMYDHTFSEVHTFQIYPMLKELFGIPLKDAATKFKELADKLVDASKNELFLLEDVPGEILSSVSVDKLQKIYSTCLEEKNYSVKTLLYIYDCTSVKPSSSVIQQAYVSCTNRRARNIDYDLLGVLEKIEPPTRSTINKIRLRYFDTVEFYFENNEQHKDDYKIGDTMESSNSFKDISSLKNWLNVLNTKPSSEYVNRVNNTYCSLIQHGNYESFKELCSETNIRPSTDVYKTFLNEFVKIKGGK